MQISRPRRNRKNPQIRSLLKENSLTVNDLIMPLFVKAGEGEKVAIDSMPGQFRYTEDTLVEKIKELVGLGIKCVALFPAIEDTLKTSEAEEAYNPNGLYQKVIRKVKKEVPQMLIMTDVALDPYNSDGHDGIVDKNTGEILNDETIEALVKMALVQADAGADIIGPSDMMDGRVGAIRKALEKEGQKNVSILAYTAKYCSSFYGPFRDALDSAPKAGDKLTYQMDFFNSREALRELKQDIKEGADMVMVKPGLPYLDIISLFKRESTLPVVAYNVSGEYSMVKAAALNGWLDGEKVMVEMLSSFKRAGADLILTYFAEEMALYLQNQEKK